MELLKFVFMLGLSCSMGYLFGLYVLGDIWWSCKTIPDRILAIIIGAMGIFTIVLISNILQSII